MEHISNGAAIQKEYQCIDAWGLSSGIDLHSCNGAIIRDANQIKRFVVALCDHIGMKRFGECTVVHFGEDDRVEGFSMTQLIETSLISGHFSNLTNTVYLDVFSCKYYNPYEVAEFAKDFFGSSDYTLNYTLRK